MAIVVVVAWRRVVVLSVVWDAKPILTETDH